MALSHDGRMALLSYDDKLLVWDFARAKNYLEFQPRVEAAQKVILINPNDASALATIGEWYAFRGMDGWAADMLEKARDGGAKISSLALARCYWSLGQYKMAKEEFQKSLQRKEAPEYYLLLCIGAVERQGSMIPATQITCKKLHLTFVNGTNDDRNVELALPGKGPMMIGTVSGLGSKLHTTVEIAEEDLPANLSWRAGDLKGSVRVDKKKPDQLVIPIDPASVRPTGNKTDMRIHEKEEGD